MNCETMNCETMNRETMNRETMNRETMNRETMDRETMNCETKNRETMNRETMNCEDISYNFPNIHEDQKRGGNVPSKCKFSWGIYGDSTQYVISEGGGYWEKLFNKKMIKTIVLQEMLVV